MAECLEDSYCSSTIIFPHTRPHISTNLISSVMSQPQKQDCHTRQRMDLARPFLVSPAIKIEIETASKWPKRKAVAHGNPFLAVWNLLETRSSLHYASKSKLGFVQAQAGAPFAGSRKHCVCRSLMRPCQPLSLLDYHRNTDAADAVCPYRGGVLFLEYIVVYI